MALGKNGFSAFILTLFVICAVWALLSGIFTIGSALYLYLYYGSVICAIAGLIMLVLARLHIGPKLPEAGMAGKAVEFAVVLTVLLLGTAARVWAISRFQILPSTDFQTYYIIAQLLSEGALSGSEYCGYIAMFPHVMGYPFFLSLLFRITGPSLLAGLYFNMAAGMLCVFLVYRVARLLGGRLCGLIALIAAAFWPSMVLYGAILASEPVFTCILLFSIWLFIRLFKCPANIDTIEPSVFLSMLLGACVALASAVRPVGLIVLTAFAICLVPQAVRFDVNGKMLYGKFSRAACQGWFRALVMAGAYFICSWLISGLIAYAIGYKLPGAGSSFGFNLMLGVNVDANGAWNEADAQYFGSVFTQTGSATAAHQAGLRVALDRIKDEPSAMAGLAVRKFSFLWKNDDYAVSWLTLFLKQQGGTTLENKRFIDSITVFNNCLYLLTIAFSALFGWRRIKRKENSPAEGLILLFLGTAALHVVLETQNRYHYYILPVFMILASCGIAELYRVYCKSLRSLPRGKGRKAAGTGQDRVQSL